MTGMPKPASRRRFTRSQKDATAFHEAGHAVAADTLGIRIFGLSIRPHGTVDGLCQHRHPHPRLKLDTFDALDDRARAKIERHILIKLSGPAAQQLHNPRGWRRRHGAGDFEAVTDLISRLGGSDEQQAAYFRFMCFRARDLIRSRWDDVTNLARLLVEMSELSEREIEEALR